MLNITAQPNGRRSFNSGGWEFRRTYSDYDERISREDRKRQPLGFCDNRTCSGKKKRRPSLDGEHYLFRIRANNVFGKGFVTNDKKVFECPDCSYALIWTRRYCKMPPIEQEDSKHNSEMSDAC